MAVTMPRVRMREAWEQQRHRGLMKLASYLEPQDRHFARFQGSAPTVLEIGVLGGGSLDVYRRYFGDGSTVIGLDIDPACRRFEDPERGIHVRIGDQADRGFLADVAAEFGPFDIVSDDGGHLMTQQVASFEVLWPHVADAGVYVCEDSFTSYDPAFVDGPTFIELAKAKIDELHAWCGPQPPTDFTREATSICFYFGLVVFEKGRVTKPELLLCLDEGFRSAPLPSVIYE